MVSATVGNVVSHFISWITELGSAALLFLGMTFASALSLAHLDSNASPFGSQGSSTTIGLPIATSSAPKVLSAEITTLPTVASTSTISSQSKRIDEHLTINDNLRDVNFCGTTYRAKQVFIDGVDVVQRIAVFATEGKMVPMYPQYKGTGEICAKLAQHNQEHGVLKIATSVSGQVEGGTIVYPLDIDSVSFVVNLVMNNIAEVGGPEFPDPGNFGVFIPIGELR